MENKYFTPDIEDIRVGYEYESLQKQEDGSEKWVPQKIVRRYDLEGDWEGWLHYGIVRTPYLTKEQIEGEGWTKEKSYFIKNNIYLFFEDKFLEIDSGNPFSWEAIDSEILFKGKCKDINTFRKICKLLEI